MTYSDALHLKSVHVGISELKLFGVVGCLHRVPLHSHCPMH